MLTKLLNTYFMNVTTPTLDMSFFTMSHVCLTRDFCLSVSSGRVSLVGRHCTIYDCFLCSSMYNLRFLFVSHRLKHSISKGDFSRLIVSRHSLPSAANTSLMPLFSSIEDFRHEKIGLLTNREGADKIAHVRVQYYLRLLGSLFLQTLKQQEAF